MKKNLTVVGLAVILLSLGAPLAGYAACAPGLELVADGVPRGMIIGGNATVTYFFQVNPGRSYSLQVTTTDPESTGLVINAILVRGCGPDGTSRDTSRLDPPLLNNVDAVFSGRRISFIPSSPTIGDGVGFNFTNTDSNPHTFQAVLVETTLYNPLWSTFSGFETFYRIQNTTRSTCTVTLTLTDDALIQQGDARTVTVPHDSTFQTIHTGPGAFPPALSVGDNQAGGATFTHDCPPGAIQIDGFLGNFSGTPIVLPIKIVAARETR